MFVGDAFGRLLVTLLAVALPLARIHESVVQAPSSASSRWLACVVCLETLVWPLLVALPPWLPLRYECVIALIVLLVHDDARGASAVYHRWLHTLLAPLADVVDGVCRFHLGIVLDVIEVPAVVDVAPGIEDVSPEPSSPASPASAAGLDAPPTHEESDSPVSIMEG